MEKVDYKKDKLLYAPIHPTILEVPEMKFLMVDGKGDPNTSAEYKEAIELLYALSYAVKMNKIRPASYYEYVVFPLEGLWWLEDETAFDISKLQILNKSKFCWTVMIRQPDFLTEEWVSFYKDIVVEKKSGLAVSKVRFETFKEGWCVQDMHIGSYDTEVETITKMEAVAEQKGYKTDMAGSRKHHEIYLSDPRKTGIEKLRTVIRHPITNIAEGLYES